MLKHRVIPCLLLKNGGVVVTNKFKKTNYVGDPINIARIFNDKEVDELVVLDILASKNKSGPNFNIIKRLASECFMPLTYGGGISSVQQAQSAISLGATVDHAHTAVSPHATESCSVSQASGEYNNIPTAEMLRTVRLCSRLAHSRRRFSPTFSVEATRRRPR